MNIERRTGASWVDGEYVEGTVTTVTADGLVQPANTRDLAMLPEGQRAGEWIRVSVSPPERVRTAVDGEGIEADIIVYTPPGEASSNRYRAVREGNWGGISGVSYVLAKRIGGT